MTYFVLIYGAASFFNEATRRVTEFETRNLSESFARLLWFSYEAALHSGTPHLMCVCVSSVW